MDKHLLQKLLQKKYNRNEWNSILGDVFPSVNLLKEPERIEVNNKNVKSFHQTGMVRLNDGKNLAVFEVVLDEGINLLRNRVALRNLTTRYIDQANNHGVLVVYDQGKENYRFTFVAQESGFNEKGEWATFETASKRFTYVLGKGESCRTASERLAYLSTKKNSAKIDDVIDAFSVERLSKEFFAKYKEHYHAFVDYLSVSSFKEAVFNGDEKAIRDFVKKTLGRIVFLYFLQKKGWLGATDSTYSDGDNNFMQTLWETSGKGKTFYRSHLCRLFFDGLNTSNRIGENFEMPNGKLIKIPFLNGGLFDKDNSEPESLTFPPNLFDGLFSFLSEYNFTIDENDPEEHEVGIDPEMLGHIFENLLEDNKDKGAFYTPKEIVQYMTQESLLEYLKTGLERKQPLSDDENTALKYFIRYKLKGDEIPKEDLKGDIALFYQNQIQFIHSFGSHLDTLLDDVKICDPAIGSGAFPMGLLNEIYRCKVILNSTYTPAERAAVKRHIIENSIYGVDLEKGAVDIARLRFWLSLIVDEEKPTPLPNLDYKIVVGDSLVSRFEDEAINIDWNVQHNTGGLFEQDLFEIKTKLLIKISEKQNKFFEPTQINKEKLKLEIRDLKLNLLINQLRLMIEQSGVKYYDIGKKKSVKQVEAELQVEGWKKALNKLLVLKEKPEKPFNHFDWKLDFPKLLNPLINEKSMGFDIVIANPPYIKEYTQKSAFDGFRSSPYYQGKMDLWYGFACVSIDLLKENGVECFIAQNNWITSAGASILRDKVLTETEIKIFTDFWNYKVFETAGIQTMVYLLKKKQPDESYELQYSVLESDKIDKTGLSRFLEFSIDDKNAKKFTILQKNKESIGKLITFNDPITNTILELIQNNSLVYLKETEVAQGIVAPQDKLNKKAKNKLGAQYSVNQGVFVLSKSEVEAINLTTEEKKLIKPYYETHQLRRYIGTQNTEEFIIYADSSMNKRISEYPNIKSHLDKFAPIITSDFKPYGLHRARNEDFFQGEKIMVQRKCALPSFTYTNFNCYVSQTFFVIKTQRINIKYLTVLLNSKLISFWLRYKGKMQGSNYQIDKEPLVNIPIIEPENTNIFTYLADYLLLILSNDTPIDSYVPNSHIAQTFEELIDAMVMELYFKKEFEHEKIEFIKFAERDFKAIEGVEESEKLKIIHEAYQKLREKGNEIRNNLKLMDTRLNRIVMPIKTV